MVDAALKFSCEDCSFDATDVCEECVVTCILGRDPQDAVVIDAEEIRAVRLLSDAQLVPALRFERRVS